MIANGDLVFQKMTKENMEKVNQKLSQITNQTHLGVSQDCVTSNNTTPDGVLHQAETENPKK